MSRPWLQDDFKHGSRSRSRSTSQSRKKAEVKVDQFGRSVPSRSKSKSRSRSGSRERNSRRPPGPRRSRERSRGGFPDRRDYGRDFNRENRDRSRERGRQGSRDRGRRRKRDGRSSSSGSDSSGGSGTRLVASTKPKYLNSRVFVANIVSKEVTKDELILQFEKYGNVVDVLVHPKNYAFIQFLKEEHAKLAVEGEHGSTMKGWRLDVKMANENRRGGAAGRGGRPGGGRGGRGSFGSMERDRSPLHDDRYGDPYRPGGPRLPPGPFPPPPAGEFGMRDPYFEPPFRRGYPDPWLPPDDLYRRDPYADPYRDPYAPRPPPPPIECEVFIVNSQLRAYGEAVERRIKEHNIITAVSLIPEGRTAAQMVEELTARDGLFAVFINPQNEMHRSLTLNILHGTPQEHRNMPLDDAITLVGRSFEKYVEGLREKANAAAAPLPTSAGPSSVRVFLPATPEVAYLLNLLADNRALTVAELDQIIQYLQERRDKLIDAESRPLITDADSFMKSPSTQRVDVQQSPGTDRASSSSKDLTPSQQEITNKILSIFSSAGGNIQGVPPANGTSQPKMPSGTPAPPPPPPAPAASSASLINFDNPNVQKALDNLIQSSPSLLKNINTKTTMSAAQMGSQSISSSMSASTVGASGAYGQAAHNSPGQMQGGAYGGMQGQMMQGMGQMTRQGPPPPVPPQGGYNQGHMGYGAPPPQPRF